MDATQLIKQLEGCFETGHKREKFSRYRKTPFYFTNLCLTFYTWYFFWHFQEGFSKKCKVKSRTSFPKCWNYLPGLCFLSNFDKVADNLTIAAWCHLHFERKSRARFPKCWHDLPGLCFLSNLDKIADNLTMPGCNTQTKRGFIWTNCNNTLALYKVYNSDNMFWDMYNSDNLFGTRQKNHLKR